MIIDTHCHLDFPELYSEIDAVMDRARKAGVEYIVNVASNTSGCLNGERIAARFPNVFYTVGIHPHHAAEVTEDDVARTQELASAPRKKLVAIGEIGLDFYKNFSPADAQRKLFLSFLALVKKTALPVIIHSRDAKDETYEMLKAELGRPVKGVMHCFSQDREYLEKILDLGMHVSFTCNITYKNAAGLAALIKYVPSDRLLIETDAPFLAPQSLRGRRNEPANLVHLVQAISGIAGRTKEEIEDATSKNAIALFGLR